MIYTAVWTVDHHPSLCGTAKFSHQLAERLGVPCVPMYTAGTGRYVLISARGSEVVWTKRLPQRYDLFLHDVGFKQDPATWILAAARIFAANRDIAQWVRDHYRPDVIEAFAPSMLRGRADRGAYRVLTFGMAHKFQRQHYETLKRTLDSEGLDYTVSVSTAIHEGSPWDETAKVGALLREVFGDRLRVLGYLADDALAKELEACDAVAVYFDPAVRANNTTYWAAVASGKRIFTNRDEWSPAPEARVSWDDLTALIHGVPCAK